MIRNQMNASNSSLMPTNGVSYITKGFVGRKILSLDSDYILTDELTQFHSLSCFGISRRGLLQLLLFPQGLQWLEHLFWLVSQIV